MYTVPRHATPEMSAPVEGTQSLTIGITHWQRQSEYIYRSMDYIHGHGIAETCVLSGRAIQQLSEGPPYAKHTKSCGPLSPAVKCPVPVVAMLSLCVSTGCVPATRMSCSLGVSPVLYEKHAHPDAQQCNSCARHGGAYPCTFPASTHPSLSTQVLFPPNPRRPPTVYLR
jgi:hypothetical protein